jgi:predicted O-methyltransferase YrrM
VKQPQHARAALLQDGMPFVGPAKGALLQSLVRDRRPNLALEVGTLCGYSALLIAQALPPRARLISLERDWKWALVVKRFVWQAAQGDKAKPVWGALQHICACML